MASSFRHSPTAVAAFAALVVSTACGYQKSSSPVAPTAVQDQSTPDAPAVSANRAPDPDEGSRLPLPDMSEIVARIAADRPELLRNSCQDHGGSWEFMDAVVDELRREDTRWGYNWKRGNVGDPSKDVVDYHWGRGDDESSTEVYIVDIVVGHCGGNPAAGWSDVTDVTFGNGTIGRWTGRGRF